MKAIQFKQTENTPFLKVINNTLTKTATITEQVNRIYINTITPNFKYTNQLGEVVSPKNCISL